MKTLMMIALVLFTSGAHAQTQMREVYQAPIQRSEERIAPPEGFLAAAAIMAIPTIVYYDAAQKRREQLAIARMEGRTRDAQRARTRMNKAILRAGICGITSVGFFISGTVKLAIEDDRATFRYEKRF